MSRLIDAYNAALADDEPMPVAASTATKMRHLVSPEHAKVIEAERDAFARLYASDHIDHGPVAGGVGWTVRTTFNAAGEIMGSTPIAEVEGLPDWHVGVCFECSGFGPPEGWSQLDRKERHDADHAAFVAEHGEGADPFQMLLRRGQGGGFHGARNIVKREADGTKIADWRNDPRNAGKRVEPKRRRRGKAAYT